MLYPHAPCPAADIEEDIIRNSSAYSTCLSECKHDLQTLFEYTGNERILEDLTQVEMINEHLKTRQALPGSPVPQWYTPEFSRRLTYIADKIDQIRFSTTTIQRLRAGRLLHEIIENVKTHIGLVGGPTSHRRVQVYMTHDQTLIALLNSLQIYTGIPNYGTALITELHYDPVNQVHFVRFFMISSQDPDLVPEPVRVNPPICGTNPECDSLQFEQNVQHLTIDKKLWKKACQSSAPTPGPILPPSVPSSVGPPLPTPPPPSIVGPPLPPSSNHDQLIVLPQPNVDITDYGMENNNIIVPNDSAVDGSLIVGPSIQPSSLPQDMNEKENQTATGVITPTGDTIGEPASNITVPSTDQQPSVVPESSTASPVYGETPQGFEATQRPEQPSSKQSSIEPQGDLEKTVSPTTTTTKISPPTATPDDVAVAKEKGAHINHIVYGIVAPPMLKNMIQSNLIQPH